MTAKKPSALFLGDDIRGIVVHVHARTKPAPSVRSGSSPSFDEFIEAYRRLRLCAVIFDVDNQSVSGVAMHNDAVAEVVARAPEMLIGFCSVDPWGGKGQR